MRVLVTGASGHIGGAVARHLCDRGHEVFGISRGRNASLPDAVQQFACDIAQVSFVREACAWLKRCDVVAHAAACLDPDPAATEASRVNCLGTHQTLWLAQATGARCFVFISGLNVLGVPQEHPITESHALAPRTAYAAGKAYGEALTVFMSGEHMRGVSLRVSSPVGPGLRRKRLFFALVDAARQGRPLTLHGTGERRQDYVDVRDVGAAVEAVLARNVQGVFHIASGRSVSNRELAERCVQALNSNSEIRFSGDPDPEEGVLWEVSIEKARAAFSYAPAYTIEDSILALAGELRREGGCPR